MHRLAALVLAAALLAPVAACSAISGAPEAEPLALLQSRPSYEQAVQTYTQMDQEIRDAVTAEVPSLTWFLDDKGLGAGCSTPFDNLGGESLALGNWTAEGPVPDEQWRAVEAAAHEVAARYGLVETIVLLDRRDDHEVRFGNPDDGTYTDLGSKVNTVMGTVTGCFLPEAE